MRLARLRQMSLGELALRGRQEASKWLERMGPAPRPHAARASGAGPAPLAAARLLAPDPGVPDLIAERWPESSRAVVAAADRALRGRFDLLGYRDLSFGYPPDWHLEAVSGRRLPRVHWTRIDPLDAAQVGDSKVVWELGRMQWLVTLAQAHRLTGEARYAEGAMAAVRSFLDDNPPGTGIHWSSSLECALRLIAWSWALALFGSEALDPALVDEMAASLAVHARHVERYLSFTFSPNTHLTGEALGLVYAGLLQPDLPRAARWRLQGLDILRTQFPRQVLEDGVYFEQAASYQRYTADMGLHLLVLARAAGFQLPDAFTERLCRTLDALLWLRQPDGSLPAIGDADGGWLLPLTRRAPSDPRATFGLAAALFSRSDYAWAAGGTVPEVGWLLGRRGLEACDRLVPEPPPEPPSRLFPHGGYAVMASGWEPDAHQLVFDVGPLGCPVSGGHGHADLLSIRCSAFGEAYVADPGTYAYTAPPGWRDFFRSSRAHATVVVDGQEQAETAGPFAWKQRPRARLQHWASAGGLDLADGSHEAYARGTDPVVHRRRVLFVNRRYWVIVDELRGASAHGFELRFPFTPRPIAVEPSLWVRAFGRGGRGLMLRVLADVPLTVRIHQGQTQPIDGWISPDYGQRVPAPTVVFAGQGRLPLRLVSVLLPAESASMAPPAMSAMPGTDGAGPAGIAFDGGETVAFSEDRVVICRPAVKAEEVG